MLAAGFRARTGMVVDAGRSEPVSSPRCGYCPSSAAPLRGERRSESQHRVDPAVVSLFELGPKNSAGDLPRQVSEMPAGRREQAHDVDELGAGDDELPLALPVADGSVEAAIPLL